MAETLIQVGILVATVVGLWVGARLLVDSAVRLARGAGLSELAIGLTVVAAGTSAPELAVSIDAAYKGFGDIAVANVLGSNVYNLAFVLGVVALIRLIPISQSLVRRDGVALLAGTGIAGALLVDLELGRLEGAALVGLLVLYIGYQLRAGRRASGTTDPDDISRDVTERVPVRGRDVLLLVAGLAVIIVSGDLLVGAASTLARGAGISEWVIGGTVVAAGTSTPEFAVSLVALRRGSVGVSVGNVVGSNLFNLLGVLGVAALIRPLAVSSPAISTLGWLVAITVLMVVALWSGRGLSRTEGGLFAGSEVVRWVLGLLG